MPYNKKYGYKKTTGYRKNYRKKYVKKYMSGKMALCKNPDIRVMKLRTVFTLTSVAGTIITTVPVRDPSGSDDWTSVAAVFDMYRVYACKVKWIPNYLEGTQALDGGGSLVSINNRQVFVFYDDDATNISAASNAQAIAYENMKVKQFVGKIWTYYVKIPKLSSASSTRFLNDKGFVDTAGNGIANGRIELYCASGLNPSLEYGKLLVTYYCGFMMKR